MTDWKSRALAAEKTLFAAKLELEVFYCTSNSIDVAKAALLRLRELLGVENTRKPGVPETLTREVSYVELNRE